MNVDYSKLKGKIKEIYNTQDAYADALSINRSTLNLKLNGKAEFTQSEMMKTCDLLNINPEEIPVYFFQIKV